jgi:nickel superoxide dismutase
MKSLLLFSLILSMAPGKVYSHCQIPCGIYDDKLQIALLKEHVKTIEKSIVKIMAIKKAKPINHNQLVRWIHNKEVHAEKIQEITWQYFMTQRIKPPAGKDKKAVGLYNTKLALLHNMLLKAMKAKQNVDRENCKALLEVVEAFEEAYFSGGH